MNKKQKFKNDILVDMKPHVDANTLAMLDTILSNNLRFVEMTDSETLPATVDNTNEYVINLFMIKKAPKLSKKTVEYYLNTMAELTTYAGKSILKMEQIDIECYLYEKQKQGNSATSLNNLKRNISAFYTWMRKVKLIQDNPCDGVESYSSVTKPVDVLDSKEYEQIKQGCRTYKQRAVIEFLRSTAVRRGEIPGIKIRDVDFSTGKVNIFAPKTKEYRTVMIDDVAKYYILKYLEEERGPHTDDDPLFTCYKYTNKPIIENGIYSIVKAVSKNSACNKNVYTHLFRHTTATNIIIRGGNEDEAGRYLGHAPKSVTGRYYIKYSDRDTIDIFNRYVKSV